jgi:hypothetical protein
MPGTEALGEHLQAKFGGSYGGYSCRPNTADGSKQSVHGTGRAIDFFPNNKAEGDAIANLCVSNHAKWGIQLVICGTATGSVIKDGPVMVVQCLTLITYTSS